MLVNGVFQWKHALANGHQEENFSVPVKVAVAANGVRSSQAHGAVAVGTPPAKITDYKVSGANGLKHENGCISNDTQHLLQPSDDVSISSFPSNEGSLTQWIGCQSSLQLH